MATQQPAPEQLTELQPRQAQVLATSPLTVAPPQSIAMPEETLTPKTESEMDDRFAVNIPLDPERYQVFTTLKDKLNDRVNKARETKDQLRDTEVVLHFGSRQMRLFSF